MRTYYIANIETGTIKTRRCGSMGIAELSCSKFERAMSTRQAAENLLSRMEVVSEGPSSCERCGAQAVSIASDACPLCGGKFVENLVIV